MNRREYLKMTGLAAAGLLACQKGVSVPGYLKGYDSIFSLDPRKAAIDWFKDAKFGLFMHYGLYSLLGRGEWVMLTETIPVAEYAKLFDQFTADKFDADLICNMAVDAGMKYVNITSKHHDGFCLFNTKATDFNSVKAPSKRDLVYDLANACAKRDLGFFLYYSYAADWKHPYFYPREKGWSCARPDYKALESTYLFKEDADFRRYVDFVHVQLEELLSQYGPIAGIWFDPIMGYYKRPDLFPIEETYHLIRSKQPQCLISFKQGANGSEDFVAPERHVHGHTQGGHIGSKIWQLNKDKPKEICDTLQPKGIPGNSWGYNKYADGKHMQADDVMKMLDVAQNMDANLLLNTGPLPDGDIDPIDVKTLREVGKRIA